MPDSAPETRVVAILMPKEALEALIDAMNVYLGYPGVDGVRAINVCILTLALIKAYENWDKLPVLPAGKAEKGDATVSAGNG